MTSRQLLRRWKQRMTFIRTDPSCRVHQNSFFFLLSLYTQKHSLKRKMFLASNSRDKRRSLHYVLKLMYCYMNSALSNVVHGWLGIFFSIKHTLVLQTNSRRALLIALDDEHFQFPPKKEHGSVLKWNGLITQMNPLNELGLQFRPEMSR